MSGPISFASSSWIGLRQTQEDYGRSILIPNPNGGILAIVADGMGGHAAGELASQTAVETFVAAFLRNSAKPVTQNFGEAISACTQALAKLIADRPALEGMGTTLVAAYAARNELNFISVGDSHIYLCRDGTIKKLNEDHSMAPIIKDQVRKGAITEAEAADHPGRNALRSALMETPPPLVDVSKRSFALIQGDVVILATDGLNSLSMDEVKKLVLGPNNIAKTPEELCSRLISAVKSKSFPKQDNVTVLVGKVDLNPNSSGIKKNYTAYFGLAGALTIGLIGLGSFYAVSHFQNDSLTKEISTKSVSNKVAPITDRSTEIETKRSESGGFEKTEQQTKVTPLPLPENGNRPGGVEKAASVQEQPSPVQKSSSPTEQKIQQREAKDQAAPGKKNPQEKIKEQRRQDEKTSFTERKVETDTTIVDPVKFGSNTRNQNPKRDEKSEGREPERSTIDNIPTDLQKDM